ncbi:MAG: RecR, partial [uncultured Actinomycetospora sp.]
VRGPGPGPHRRAGSPARHRAQERPAHRVPPPRHRGGRPHPPAGGPAEGQDRCRVLRGLRQRLRAAPLPHLCRRPPRRVAGVRGRGAQGRHGRGAHPGVPRSLPRAGRGARSALGHRARPVAGPRAAHPHRRGRRWRRGAGDRRGHPRHGPQHRGRGHGHLPRAPAARLPRADGDQAGLRPAHGRRPGVRRRADARSRPRGSPRLL